MNQLFYCFVFILGPVSALADPHYFIESSQFNTSDDLKASEFRFNYQANSLNPYWNIPSEKDLYLTWSAQAKYFRADKNTENYTGSTVLLNSHFNFNNNFYLNPSIGGHQITSTRYTQSKQFLLAGLELIQTNHKSYWLDLIIKEDFFYPQVLPINGDPIDVRGQAIEPKLLWIPTSSLRIQIKNQNSWLGQKNQRSWTDSQFMWGLQTHPHWVWAGWGVEYITNSKKISTYWSPRNFFAHGPRVDVFLKIYDNWGYFMGGSYNFLKEEDYPNGTGHYINTGIQLKSDAGPSLRIYLENNSSSQNSKTWTSNSFGLAGSLAW